MRSEARARGGVSVQLRRLRGVALRIGVLSVVYPFVDHVVGVIAMGRDGAAVGPPEIPPPAIVLTDLVAPFVHQAVMGAALCRFPDYAV